MEMEKSFETVRYLMASIGLIKPDRISQRCWNIYRLLLLLSGVTFIPLAFAEAIRSKSLTHLTAATVYITSALHNYFNSIRFYMKREAVVKILDGLEELSFNQRNDPYSIKIVNKACSSSFWFIKYYIYSYLIFSLGILPILFIPSKSNENNLIFPALFPWNLDNKIFYVISIAIQFYTLGGMFFMLISHYPFIVFVVNNIEAQINILKGRLQRLDVSSRPELIKCIQHHQFILRLVRQLNKLTLGFAFEVSIAPFQTCLAGYNTSKVDLDDPMFYNHCMYFVLSLVQPLFTCWCGQKLKDSSESIGESLFTSRWHQSYSKEDRKNLLFIFTMLKESCSFSVRKVFALDYKTYSHFLSASYSYFTLLKVMEKKKGI